MTSSDLRRILGSRAAAVLGEKPAKVRKRRGEGRVGQAKKQFAARSKHERKFLLLWSAMNGPKLVEQHPFAPGRRFRFDFAHVGSRIGIELQGGVWIAGGHTRGSGALRDWSKMRVAVEHGWFVYPMSPAEINEPEIEKLISLINSRASSYNKSSREGAETPARP